MYLYSAFHSSRIVEMKEKLTQNIDIDKENGVKQN